MSNWLKPEEHSPAGEAGNYGWAHPKTGLYYNGVWGGHAKAAHEFGFRGDTETEINDNAVDAGYTRWYVGNDEIGVHFNHLHPDAPKRAKEILAYHAQNQKGRLLLADTGKDYYHGTSLKDAHDFIDRVSSGRKETDYARMKRELGESHDYDPAWDYDVDSRPHVEVAKHVDRLVGEHHERGIFSHLGVGKPTVHYVKNLPKGHFARYVNGTYSDPVLVVDSKAIHRAAKKYGVALHDAVESTLLHEYGHAHFDSAGESPDNEEEAVEHFAHHTWRTGDYVGATSDMRSMAGLKESRADTLIRRALDEGYLKGAVAPLYHWTHLKHLPSIMANGLLDPDEDSEPEISLTRDKTYAPWGTADPEKVRLTIAKGEMVKRGHRFEPTVDPGLDFQSAGLSSGRGEAEELHRGHIDPKYITAIHVHPDAHKKISVRPEYASVVKHPGYRVGFNRVHESSEPSGKWIIFHGGRDFDQLDARALGSGEPGNIRPLGKGFYGGLSTGEHDTHTAIDLAKIYGRKYGGMIHAFEVTPKPGDVNFGSWVHEPLLSDAHRKWGELHGKADSLPAGPERRAAFAAADEFRKTIPRGKFSTASVYVAGQPAIEFHTDPKALGDLKRIGKWSVDTPTEHIAKAARGGSVSESVLDEARRWSHDGTYKCKAHKVSADLTVDGDHATIHGWSSLEPGNGNTIAELQHIKKRLGPSGEISVNGIGSHPSDESWRYWVKMHGKGLVHHLHDDDGNNVTPSKIGESVLDEALSPDDDHWHSDGGKEKIQHLVRAHRADVDREIKAVGGEHDCVTTAKAWARKLHASGVKDVSVVHGRYLGGYSPVWGDTLGDHSWVQHGKHIFDPAAGFSFSDYPNMLHGKYAGDVWDRDPKLWESMKGSTLTEGFSPDEAKKLSVKLDPEMEGFDSKYTWFDIHHADHGKIGIINGPITNGHLNVQSMGLDKEYLEKRGIHTGRDYGNWWSSADVARDHKISANHLGPAGIRQIMRELKTKHGVTSVGSTERVTGSRLKAYAKGRGVPRASIKSFTTGTYKLPESRADYLIREALAGLLRLR